MRRRECFMETMFVLVPLAAAIIALSGAGRSAQRGNSPTLTFGEKLRLTVPVFKADNRPMAQIAVQMAFRYKLPMAIEHVDREAMQKPLNLKIIGQSVREVIAAVVDSVPGYSVDFSQGLVDIYSSAARADPSNPFNVKIPAYEVDGLDTHLADAELLCDIGRVLHGHSGCGGSVAGGQWGNRKITLHLENKRVYEILNAIVAQNGDALWTPIGASKMTSPLISGNFWYIFPLRPPFQGLVSERLAKLLRQQDAAQ